MNDTMISTTIEILGKLYPVRCEQSELATLQEAAQFLHEKMREVQQSGKALNLERIAIITALNMTSLYLKEKNSGMIDKINQHLLYLQKKIDKVLDDTVPTDLIYHTE